MKRTNTSPANHYQWYAAGCILAILLFAGGVFVAHSGRPTGWEVTIFRAINDWPAAWSGVFGVVTFFGSVWGAVLAVVVSFACKMYRLTWRLAITIVGAYGAAYIAKHVIGRSRPQELLAGVHIRATESGMGFPSGHATISTVIALTVLPYLPRWVAYISVPLFIGLICLSRLYLGVHLPLDVIGGTALGAAAVCFIRILPDQLRKWARID